MAVPKPEYLSETFRRFFGSEKAGGIMLIACTAVSLAIANSPMGDQYAGCGTSMSQA